MNRSERIVVALTGSSHALSHGYQLIFPGVLLLIQKEFSLGYFELGMIGNIMNLTYGLGALPGGMLYNRLGPKKLYLLCFLGSSAALILVGFSSGLLLFAAGLAILGAAGSLYHPLANSLITAKVREYGRALGIHGAAGNLGLAVAPFCVALIASSLGWRYAYLWFALPGVLLSICALFVDLSQRKGLDATSPSTQLPSAQKSIPKSLQIYFSLPLIWLYLINIMINFGFVGSITFLPAYMAKRTSFHLFHLDRVAVGGALSAIVLFIGVFGQLSGGLLSQRPRLERNLLLISALSVPFVLAISFTTDLLLLALALVYFFLNFFLQPMSNTLLAQYTTPDMRGTAFGIFFFVSFVLGSLASSFCGYIAQTFGLRWVFMGLSGSGFLLSFFAFLLEKRKRSA